MMNLAEFKGLAPAWAARLPAILYFHENQFEYPSRNKRQRKQNEAFGFVNMIAASAADEIWFNSAFNRDSFLDHLEKYLKARPDCQPLDICRRLYDKSRIVYPGIYLPRKAGKQERQAGPLRIAWAARWEYDKGPEIFFAALRKLKERKVPFRLRVLGEQFGRCPPVFDAAAAEFKNEIDAWGYEASREAYLNWLADSDLIVSTAIHEFFGISILEGAACGAVPILPAKLSYPEIFAGCDGIFYDGTADGLREKLTEMARLLNDPDPSHWQSIRRVARNTAYAYEWPKRIVEFDELFENEGGFAERLYRVRSEKRKTQK